MEFKDYYKALGVERGADQKTISRAFRRLAREFHPDVNRRRGAEDRFKELNEAYQVLGDPARRAQYDQIYDAYKNGGVPLGDLLGRAAGGRQAWSGPGGFTVTVGGAGDLHDLFGRPGGFSEFFQQLFGGMGGVGGHVAGPRAPGRIESTIEITLEDALRGGKRRVELPAYGRRLDVEIPRGVRDGQTIRLAGAAAGEDVYLTVRITPHRLFERRDDDLIVEVPVTITEAVLGATIEVPTPDGRVTMTVPPETQAGRLFRLKGLGMPKARGAAAERGDLYVRVKVVVPTGLSARERALFEELRATRREDPRRGLFS